MTTSVTSSRKQFYATVDKYLDGYYAGLVQMNHVTFRQAITTSVKKAKEIIQMGREHVEMFIYFDALCVAHIDVTNTSTNVEAYESALRLVHSNE